MFDEQKIVLQLAVLSDLHASGVPWNIERCKTRLKHEFRFCEQLANGKLDAFLFNGDFTNAMNSPANVVRGKGDQPEDYEEAKTLQNANEFAIWREVLATIDEKIDIIYTLGNHDGHANSERFITEFCSRDEIGDNKNFERMFRTDLDLEAMREGVRHCVVGGYHILCLDIFKDYTEPLARMKQWLDEITTAEPEKYVFVLFHYKVPNTVIFGDYTHGISPALGELLKHYPQVVLLTGHTHSPLQNERSIWQGEYTVVENSSASYIIHNSLEISDVNANRNTGITRQQGILLQIDADGNVRILKLDFAKEATIGEPWFLPKPTKDGRHLQSYTNARAHRYPAPKFQKDAALTVAPLEEDKTALSFPAALHEDMVYRYEAVVTNKVGNSQVFYISSLFCYDNPDPDTVSVEIPFPYESIARISVTPQDVWFKCGGAIHFNRL